jgi:hypothetical protein
MASVRKVPCVRATGVRRLNLVACSFEPTKKDLMISKIITRAACLRELASNPKSFSNCPDLHGGVPDLARDGDRICTKPALGKNRSARRQFAVLVP